MSIGMIWFWLLVAPDLRGTFSFLGKLSIDFADFTPVKPYLQIAVPLACVAMITYVREFLFVRGFGLVLLMAAAPLLYAADFEVAPLRLIIPIVAYAMIIKGLYFVGMPYLFRDGVTWLTASAGRWKATAGIGLVLGLLILGCSFTVWKGY
jgi:cytochrome c biogenesis protein CcdA